MEFSVKHILKSVCLLGLPMVGTLITSCTQVADSWMVGSMAAAAKNQIMLVRKDPPSFGYQRLDMLSNIYPEMAIFISKRGLPDFLAETGERDRQYFIFYYLRDRQAFACRTRQAPGKGVEFAGPYPITDREFHALDDFRRDPRKKPEKFR